MSAHVAAQPERQCADIFGRTHHLKMSGLDDSDTGSFLQAFASAFDASTAPPVVLAAIRREYLAASPALRTSPPVALSAHPTSPTHHRHPVLTQPHPGYKAALAAAHAEGRPAMTVKRSSEVRAVPVRGELSGQASVRARPPDTQAPRRERAVRRRIWPAERGRIKSWYRGGTSIAAIARSIGRARSTIGQIVHPRAPLPYGATESKPDDMETNTPMETTTLSRPKHWTAMSFLLEMHKMDLTPNATISLRDIATMMGVDRRVFGRIEHSIRGRLESTVLDFWFSKDAEAEDKLIALTKRASKTLDIAMFILSSAKLTEAIVEAAKRVIVRVIVDRKQAINFSAKMVQILYANGVSVYHAGSELMHWKVCIVDNDIMSMGSCNWSTAGLTKNWEQTVVLRGPIVGIHTEEFDKTMWRYALQHNGKITVDEDGVVHV